jgi:hypothetical protein
MWQTKLSLEKLLFRIVILVVCIGILAGCGGLMLAQEPPGPPSQQQAPALAPRQLDNLVAPIALYPDPLLSQVLVASTYPLELVEAQQWLEANKDLEGRQLTDAAREQNWDASVQAMVALPDVLAKLTQNIRWTTDLGNAFLAQQADVMSAVQRMRSRAQANGRLRSTPQETVTTERQDGQAAIQILPADPQVIYVPTYDPAYIWGPPLWGYYPPLFYPGFGFGFGPGIDIGFCFGGWGGWGWGGWGWGWGPNWFGRSIFVNNFFFNHYGYRGGGYGRGYGGGYGGGRRGGYGDRSAWLHDPSHRLGVNYQNSRLNTRYGAASQSSRMAAARSGNLPSQGMRQGGGFGGRNSFAGGTQQAGARNSQAQSRTSSGWQRFNSPQQGGQASAPRNQAAQSHYSTQGYQSSQRGYGTAQQGYQSSQRSYGGYQSSPQRSYSYQSPQRSYGGGYQGAQRSYQSAPRASAPSYGGGGGIRSGGGSGGGGGGVRSGGGGGGVRSSSGGGGGSHGGGGHSGRR